MIAHVAPPRLDEIALGHIYEYTCGIPVGCAGELYRPHRLVLDVPVYSWKVLVEALSGHDQGMWFTCSIDNFCRRYRLSANQQQAVTPVGKEIEIKEGSGF